MRIVGGTLGGRRFDGPPSNLTRPTSERVREALASALDSRGAIGGARVLDLFAGTGALAFEALSRGATHACLVERDPRVVKAAHVSIAALGLGERCTVVRADLGAPLATLRKTLFPALALRGPFDLTFVDPPYADIERVAPLLDALADDGLLAPAALVAIEHRHAQPPGPSARLAPEAVYRYGDTGVRLLTLT